ALATATVVLAALVDTVVGESHTVHFDNRNASSHAPLCSPPVQPTPNVLSTGSDFTSNGALISAIAYLQTGACGFNGEGCTLIETTLVNPTSPGSGSSTDISLIPPHSFSITSGFGYFNGCDGMGVDCNNANCDTAFHQPNDTFVQVACQVDNVNLAITFCD
ncbi:hypothetical protein V8D89_001647, partial [Ganoderma adspersum]